MKSNHAYDILVSWTGVFATVTLAQVSLVVSIAVGLVTFGFTVHRWCYWHCNKGRRDDENL